MRPWSVSLSHTKLSIRLGVMASSQQRQLKMTSSLPEPASFQNSRKAVQSCLGPKRQPWSISALSVRFKECSFPKQRASGFANWQSEVSLLLQLPLVEPRIPRIISVRHLKSALQVSFCYATFLLYGFAPLFLMGSQRKLCILEAE